MNERAWRRTIAKFAVLLIVSLGFAAKAKTPLEEDVEAPGQQPIYVLPHPDAPWWLSGQVNVISQYHPPFPAAYSGINSLRSNAEFATSFVATVYSGFRLSPTTEVLFDLESAGGSGLSTALGLGGFTNLDVVRNPSLGPTPYIARALLHQVIPLSRDTIDVERWPFRTFSRLPARRIELRAGKLSTVDFFDINSVGSDNHTQFMNWTVDNNGAFDYAADTRGYTLGAVIEYQDLNWGLRFGEMLMPTVANGIDYDFNIAHARGENFEVELRPELMTGRATVIRTLAYLNHAHMGSYREANDAFRSGLDPTPNIEAHRQVGRTKFGFGLNAEQELSRMLRVFGRLGWNDGRNESFAYTEVDDTVLLGMDLRGILWHRDDDKLGVAFVTNGLSAAHRTYLTLGGHGFLLGDGGLTYGREIITEAYYAAHLWRGIYPAADVQFIENPGYNRDRGPVFVASLRLHAEL